MPPKKKQEEIIDISDYPKINTIVCSIILNFNYNDRKFKLLEQLYRLSALFEKTLINPSDKNKDKEKDSLLSSYDNINQIKTLRLITREQMIEYAKEKGIFVDNTDYKKNPDALRKEISNNELAKTYVLMIQDKSIPIMKNKKQLLDKIKELQKLKDELTMEKANRINNLNDNQMEVNNDNKKQNKKDNSNKTKGKEKKEEFQNPEDIIIPEISKYETELCVVFYNYPGNIEEVKALINIYNNNKNNKNNKNIYEDSYNNVNTDSNNDYYNPNLSKEFDFIKNFILVDDKDEYTELLTEDNTAIDGKKKDNKKEVKKDNTKLPADIQLLQKYFSELNFINKDYSNKDLFNHFLKYKLNSGELINPIRNACFEEIEFYFDYNEDTKIDNTITFPNLLSKILDYHNKFNIYYNKWINEKKEITDINFITYIDKIIENIYKEKDQNIINNQTNNIYEDKRTSIKTLNNIEIIKNNAEVTTANMYNQSNKVLDKNSHELNNNNKKFTSAIIENYVPIQQYNLYKVLKMNKYNIITNSNYLYNRISFLNTSKNSFEFSSKILLLYMFSLEISNFYRELEFNCNNNQENKLISNKSNDDSNQIEELFNNLERDLEYNNSNKLMGLQSNSHNGLKNIEETEAIEKSFLDNINDDSNPFRLIVDYNDKILYKLLDNKLENEIISNKEKQLLINFRNIPGINKYLLNNYSTKEQNYRKALRSEIYPFINKCSIPLYETFMTIYTFEDVISKIFTERKLIDINSNLLESSTSTIYNNENKDKKSINDISENKLLIDYNELNTKYIDFGNRIYNEPMDKDILCQLISKLNFYDTDNFSMYNEIDDNLYLTSYYRIPNARVYYKLTKNRYLSVPEYQNFLNDFKPIVVIEDEKKQISEENNVDTNVENAKDQLKPNTNLNNNNNINNNSKNKILSNKNVVKYNVNPDIENKENQNKYNTSIQTLFDIPNDKILYVADDNKVKEISEKIKYMYPCDNSAIIRKEIFYGIYSSFYNYVVKDNLVFGIRKNCQNHNEIWINFDNDIKCTISHKNYYDSVLSDTNNINNKNIINNDGNTITISLKNGLEIQILPTGDILQKNHRYSLNLNSTNSKNNNSNCNNIDLLSQESHRIITSKASVLSYKYSTNNNNNNNYYYLNSKEDAKNNNFSNNLTTNITDNHNEEINIMYSNGNTCNIKNNFAVNTNNKGYKIGKNINENKYVKLENLKVTNQTDPETKTKTMIREDKVLNILYKDNSLLTIHADDTKIFTFPSKQKYLIEHDKFASVEVRNDETKRNLKTIISEGGIDALLGSDDLMIRSYDGKLNKVILPDLTEVISYKEMKKQEDSDNLTLNTVVLIKRKDGTIIKSQQDGEVIIMSYKERFDLIQGNNDKLLFDNEIDFEKYFDLLEENNNHMFEIYGKKEERKGGIYTGDLKKGILYTKDNERNIFELNVNGSAKEKLSVSLDIENSNKSIDEIKEKHINNNLFTKLKKNDIDNILLINNNPAVVNLNINNNNTNIKDNKAKNNTNNKNSLTAQNNAKAKLSTISNNNLNNKINTIKEETNEENNEGNSIDSKNNVLKSNKDHYYITVNQKQNTIINDYEKQEFEYINPESVYLDTTSSYINPRLFLIRSDSTGYELLNKNQLFHFRLTNNKHYFNNKNINNLFLNTDTYNLKNNVRDLNNLLINNDDSNNNNMTKYFIKELNNDYKSHCWFLNYRSILEQINDTQLIKNIKIPRKLDKIVCTPYQSLYPKKDVYIYRNIIEHKSFDMSFRYNIKLSIKDKQDWFTKKIKDFGKKEIFPTGKELEETRTIQSRILKERQTEDFIIDYNYLKNGFSDIILNNNNNNNNKNSLYSKSVVFDINEYINQQKNKIINEYSDLRNLPLDQTLIDVDKLQCSLKDYKDKTFNNNFSSNYKTNKKIKEALNNMQKNKEVKFVSRYFDSLEGREAHNKISVELSSKKSNYNNVQLNNITNNNNSNIDKNNNNNQILEEEDSLSNKDKQQNEIENVFSNDNNNYNNSNNNNQDHNSKEDNDNNNIISEYKSNSLNSVVQLKSDNELDLNLIDKKYFIRKIQEANRINNNNQFKNMNFNHNNLPSISKLNEITKEQYDKQLNNEAKRYHEIKSYKYDYLGKNKRKDLEFKNLQYLKTTFPEAEFNEDYIYIEKITDPRIKTSSVARRLYFNAPSVNEIRKKGQHNFLMHAIDKKNTYDEMMERINLMITSELCDPLNKNLKINPVKINFGSVKHGNKYYCDLFIRNDDNMTSRIQVLKDNPNSNESKRISLDYFIGGKVSYDIFINNDYININLINILKGCSWLFKVCQSYIRC